MSVAWAQVALTEFVLTFVVFLAYVGWSVYLKFVRKIVLSNAVWIVALSLLFAWVPALIAAVGFWGNSSSPSKWLLLGMIVCLLLWSLPVYLLARGLFIHSPTLSDAAKVHIKQLLALTAVLIVAGALACLPLEWKVEFSIQISTAFLMIAFAVFFFIRLVQAVKASRASIEMQNLIPQPRRVAFDKRFKQFLLLSLITFIGAHVVTTLLFALFVFWLEYSSPLPALALVTQISHLLLMLFFCAGVGFIFLPSYSESLKLWTTTGDDFKGFETLQEQDADLFA
jgi:hypothetical protein